MDIQVDAAETGASFALSVRSSGSVGFPPAADNVCEMVMVNEIKRCSVPAAAPHLPVLHRVLAHRVDVDVPLETFRCGGDRRLHTLARSAIIHMGTP